MYHYSGALRGLLWPHLVPITPPKASQPFELATDRIETPSSSAGIAPQIKTPNIDLRRRSSDGNYPCSPTSYPLSLCNPEINYQVSGSSSKKAKMALSTLCVTEEKAILEPHASLRTPPEGSGDNIGHNSNPQLPPWPTASDGAINSAVNVTELPTLPETPLASPRVDITHRRSPSPLVMAVDAASDGMEELSHLPDSPLRFARFELGARRSFDTSVRDLIQSRPDSPIGGQEAAPVAMAKPQRLFNIGTLVTKLPPRIEISRADVEPCCEDDVKTPPKSCLRGSESQDMPGVENLHPGPVTHNQESEYSSPIFTAPESLKVLRRTDSSDDSNDVDRLQLTMTDVRDFALASDGSRSKKASKVPEHDMSITDTNDPDYCEECISPMTIPLVIHSLKVANNPSSKLGEQDHSANETGKKGNAVKSVPIGVLTDSTGELAAPTTPKFTKTKVQVMVRKCRGAMIRTPLLVIILGRELAPCASKGLKVIATGVPIEPLLVIPAAMPSSKET